MPKPIVLNSTFNVNIYNDHNLTVYSSSAGIDSSLPILGGSSSDREPPRPYLYSSSYPVLSSNQTQYLNIKGTNC